MTYQHDLFGDNFDTNDKDSYVFMPSLYSTIHDSKIYLVCQFFVRFKEDSQPLLIRAMADCAYFSDFLLYWITIARCTYMWIHHDNMITLG